jgi:hypothetical protein
MYNMPGVAIGTQQFVNNSSLVSGLCLKERAMFPHDASLIMFTSCGFENKIKGMDDLDSALEWISRDTEQPLMQRLEPITLIDKMTQQKRIFLQSIEFAGYDLSKQIIGMPDIDEEDEPTDNVVGAAFIPAISPLSMPVMLASGDYIDGGIIGDGIGDVGDLGGGGAEPKDPEIDTEEDDEEEEEEYEKGYANEYVIGSMLSNSWQPNFFRPRV